MDSVVQQCCVPACHSNRKRPDSRLRTWGGGLGGVGQSTKEALLINHNCSIQAKSICMLRREQSLLPLLIAIPLTSPYCYRASALSAHMENTQPFHP